VGSKHWRFLVAAAGLTLLLQGCSRTLSVENGDVEKAISAIAQAGVAARQNGTLGESSQDSARRNALKEVLIEPIKAMGCDPDASIRQIAQRFRNGDVPEDKRDVTAGFLQTYASSANELEHFGLISSSTAATLRDNFSSSSN
jgi:hypothetical protein